MAIAPYGYTPYGYESSDESYVVEATETPSIDIVWTLQTATPKIIIDFDGWIEATPSVDIVWLDYSATGNIAGTVETIVNEERRQTPSINLSWQYADVSGYPATAETWSADVIIGGTSYASRLTGQLTIDYEEDSSGIASFILAPGAGSIDQMSWIGKKVFIDITAASTVRRFNGLVSNAEYFPDTGLMRFSCTTDLQGYFENADRDTIDTIVGGYWSEHIFNDDGDGWTYTQDRMSTQYAEIHQDANLNPVVVSLEAKATPDYTFTDSARFNNTLTITRATRRTLVNRIRLAIDYRFVRLRQRHITYVFDYAKQVGNSLDALSFCDFLSNQYSPCKKADIESAIDNTGWQLYGDIQYYEYEPTGNYSCPGYVDANSPQTGDMLAWIVSDEVLDSICTSARFKLAKRFAQDVTEQYIIDVRSNDSIEYVGELSLDQKFAVDNDYDASAWESEEFTSVDSSANLESSGDYILDAESGDNGRSAFETAQTTAIAQAMATIKKSHRENIVSFVVPYHPAVGLEHTVKVESSYLTAKGKVLKRVDTFNFDSGAASTELSIAISAHGGSGIDSDTPLAPVDVSEVPIASYTKEYLLPYHIGGEQASEPYSENWTGYICNRFAVTGPYPRYEVSFKIGTPEIESGARDAVTLQKSETFTVEIKSDTLNLSA